MLALRKSHIRSMIARGEAPDGYRINDEQTGFVLIGNPAWPVRPLDPCCHHFTEPSLELTALIRKVIPGFDPESNRKVWSEVAELVRRRGRTAEELPAMNQDDLIAFFRVEVFESRPNGPFEGGRRHEKSAKHAVTLTAATPTAAAKDGNQPEKSTSEILREWLGDPERKPKLVATLSSEKAGRLIGRSESSVRGAGDAWKELKAEFRTYRAFRRFERKRRSQ